LSHASPEAIWDVEYPGPVRWRGGAARLAGRAAAAAETRAAPWAVLLVALVAYWLQAVAIPLGRGRDFNTYLGAYVQLFWSDPIDLGYVLGRTPLAPFVVGGVLDVAGGALAEPAMSLLYAASIVAWFLAARSFGGRAALLTAIVLLLYPGYAILFHELSSDPIFAAAFAGWSLLTVRVLSAPSVARFALVGTGVAVLVLVRPGNQVLLVLALLPLLCALPWRARLASVAAFLVPAAVLLGAWTIHNGVLWDDYTLARGGNSGVPFYRAFLVDRIVRPNNGPASRELAHAVQRDLLPQEPYRSYGIDLHTFFADATPRMQEDLVALSNRLWGWKSDERKLREVGVEAVRTHPGAYAKGVSKTFWQLLHDPVYRSLGSTGGGSGGGGGRSNGTGETIVVNGRRLPKPSEGELIPAAHEGGVTTPDRSIYTVWTSPTEHHLVFVHPGDEERLTALHARMDELAASLPDRSGNGRLALRFNQSSRWNPPPVLWLVVGIVALAIRRPGRLLALVAPAVAGLIVILVSALGLPAVPQYSVPVAPAFVLLAAGGLLGPRRYAARQ
jgi:Dolichyl-phosphate-mannose-protein mannosyltransferase